MSRTRRRTHIRKGDAQRITVRGVRRDPVDYRKLSRAILMLAQAQAEADAKAEAAAKTAAVAKAAADATAETKAGTPAAADSQTDSDACGDGKPNTMQPEGGSV